MRNSANVREYSKMRLSLEVHHPVSNYLRHLSSSLALNLLTLLLLIPLSAIGVIRDGGIDPSNLGKGDWVYSMKDATNQLHGYVPSVTNETSLMLWYKSQGIRFFVVKMGSGINFYSGCYHSPCQLTTSLVNTAHANGILIFGYNFPYGTNVTGEVAMADYVFNAGADGFIWDAESNWESGTLGAQG